MSLVRRLPSFLGRAAVHSATHTFPQPRLTIKARFHGQFGQLDGSPARRPQLLLGQNHRCETRPRCHRNRNQARSPRQIGFRRHVARCSPVKRVANRLPRPQEEVSVPVTRVTPVRNKLDRPRQPLRWATRMRSRQGGPAAAQDARPLVPRHRPGEAPRCPVCPRPRPARPTPISPPPHLVAPVRAHLAARTSRPVRRFLRRFRVRPRNPRETAGG